MKWPYSLFINVRMWNPWSLKNYISCNLNSSVGGENLLAEGKAFLDDDGGFNSDGTC